MEKPITFTEWQHSIGFDRIDDMSKNDYAERAFLAGIHSGLTTAITLVQENAKPKRENDDE